MSTERCVELGGAMTLGCRDEDAPLAGEAVILSLLVVLCMLLFVEGCKRLFKWRDQDED